MTLAQQTQKYRIFYEDMREHLPGLRKDRAMYAELRGTAGTRLYVHGEEALAVSCESPRVITRLRQEIPEASLKTGSVLIFPQKHLDVAAEAIHARKRRGWNLTEEQREEHRRRGHALAEMMRIRKERD